MTTSFSGINPLSNYANVEHLLITNVHLPAHPEDPNLLWTVECFQGKVVSITPYEKRKLPLSFGWYEIDGKGCILLPSYVAPIRYTETYWDCQPMSFSHTS